MSADIVEPRPGQSTGRVVVPIVVSNVDDVRRAARGEVAPASVRRVQVAALVDSGATFLCMPESLIAELGLPFNRVRETRTVTGPVTLNVYGGARLLVEGRECDEEIMGLPEGRQVLLGQIPLEKLDFWIDLSQRRLVGNPEHDGEWMAEVY